MRKFAFVNFEAEEDLIKALESYEGEKERWTVEGGQLTVERRNFGEVKKKEKKEKGTGKRLRGRGSYKWGTRKEKIEINAEKGLTL